MNVGDAAVKDSAILEKALHRLETLTETLEHVADSKARESARELLELVLDLHGLALARISSIAAASEHGVELVARLIGDPHVRAILLLHGLHPHDAGLRLRKAIERMHPQWNARGFRVDLVGVAAAIARIRIHRNGSPEPADAIRQEVEEAMIEAAPDLDDIAIEIDSGLSVKATELAM